MLSKPKAIILSGYGLNCEEETKFAFEMAGAHADIIHINDLITGLYQLKNYQILAIPGGFAYGDDTGSGNAYSWRLKNHLWSKIVSFIRKDKLVIGICNGFQVLVNLGLLPSLDRRYGKREVALIRNDSARYTVRWVDLKIENNTPWFNGIRTITLPIAHGEGKFFTTDAVMKKLNNKQLVACRYIKDEICELFDLCANPNGALENVAGITDETGRILGMMPHPERAIQFTQLPHWTFLAETLRRQGKRLPKVGPGYQIFKNGVAYFK